MAVLGYERKSLKGKLKISEKEGISDSVVKSKEVLDKGVRIERKMCARSRKQLD